MEENERTKEKKCQTFRFKKGLHFRGGEVFYTICPVQSTACKSCVVVVVVVVCLFICRRRHQSETKLVSENNIQSVHKIYITTLFICDAIIL